ncbi:MAG: hypothetical protein IJT97_09815 [Bacteroidaceae bacterium]|nr:hypothetical protein [Bacteroidaceae bacterium]
METTAQTYTQKQSPSDIVSEPVAVAYVAEAPKAQIPLESVWSMLQAFDKDSRQWLRDRLNEEAEDMEEDDDPVLETKEQQEEYVRKTLTRAIHEYRESKRTGKKLITFDELLKEMETWE